MLRTPIKLILCLGQLFCAAEAAWNPIIPGWNPDPAILRVDKDYYVATSTFEYFPSTAIYHSTDLSNWTLISHGLTRPSQVQLYGTPTGAGTWAPSLSYFDGKFWLTSMTRWVYDPVARVFPRIFFVSSPDLISWSDLVWADPWGIDPELFQDPNTGKNYLNLMAVNNNKDRLWGISQCEINTSNGKCIGPYVSLWNGTLDHTPAARPEGPKMLFKDGWYYLLIAEGGTSDGHRATIARSKSPQGPYDPNPNNPLIHNGKWGPRNLTIQSTGHATLVDTPDGDWYASFLARRNIKGSSPLGRESFLTNVTWEEGWPVFNGGKPILISEPVGPDTGPRQIPAPWVDRFQSKSLDPSWYQLRTPYTENFRTSKRGLEILPNVYDLSDRDVPAAILRKQVSLNMTFSATLLGFNGTLGPRNRVGISSYLSEFQHQDIGIRGCVQGKGMCLYTELRKTPTVEYWETPLNQSNNALSEVSLHIRATPLQYSLGYSFGQFGQPKYVSSIASSWQDFAPANFSIFTGASFALFATADGEPWPLFGPEVGFSKVTETYFEENIPDYDRW